MFIAICSLYDALLNLMKNGHMYLRWFILNTGVKVRLDAALDLLKQDVSVKQDMSVKQGVCINKTCM